MNLELRNAASADYETRRMSATAIRLSRRLALLVLLAIGGCGAQDIETEYGRRTGPSVNGTAAFAEMMRESGFRVATWKRFSPKLDEADLLLWFHDEFTPPNPKQREFVERWMSRGHGRTLVYVGRDFDGATGYWRAVDGQLSGPDWVEARRRQARALVEFEDERAAQQESPTRWFTVKSGGHRVYPTTLSGPWAEGVDAKSASVELGTRLVPPSSSDLTPAKPSVANPLAVLPTLNPGSGVKPPPPKPVAPPANAPATAPTGGNATAENVAAEDSEPRADYTSKLDFTPLLTTDRGEVIAMRVTQTEASYPDPSWNDGQVIVIANGSFLVNVALANHENRKLAARVIDECGDGGRAVFLESSSNGLPVLSEELDEKPNGFSLFGVWPQNVLVCHLAALGILYCLSKFPIFGRPKQLPSVAASDFGKHITALGEMLEKSRNPTYARKLLANFHAMKTKDSR